MKQRLYRFSIVACVLTTLNLSVLATAGDEVPFKARSGGLITNVGFDPAQNIVYLHQSGTGQATQLGRFALDGNSEVLLAASTTRTSLTLTAANGDQLFLKGDDGRGTGPTSAAGTLRVIGGTGRFEGATGSLQFVLTFAIAPPTMEPNPYTEVIEGTISLK
jgi:hypothetical protein